VGVLPSDGAVHKGARPSSDTFPADMAAWDDQGYLLIGRMRADELARRYGTPLYVVDLPAVRRRMARYREALARVGGVVAYAAKAFLPLFMAQVVRQEGLWLDVVSAGEIATALRGGVPPQHLLLHGNGKTDEELKMAVHLGIGRVVVDSLGELGRLQEEAARQGRVVDVLLRVTPGVEAGAHHAIQTGGEGTKFGFPLKGGAAAQAVRQALSSDRIRLRGLHCHIGSQILELAPFRQATLALLEFAATMREETGYWPEDLDLGGGLGVRYTPEDDPPTVEAFVDATAGTAARWCQERGLGLPRIFLEPGRSVVAEAGYTVYTVVARKELPQGPVYITVDGGMGDNPRPALYGAVYTALPVRRREGAPTEHVVLAGRYCESGDVLVEGARLPRLDVGDRVVLLTTGAYTYSMASTYNRVPRAAVAVVEGDTCRLGVQRETYEDLLRLEVSLWEEGPAR
jgi:diaminopimelate decarboxylase